MKPEPDDVSRGGPGGPPLSRVVLVGGGHAHLELVRRGPRFRRRGIELHLVDPGDFAYSGGAAAVLGGALPPEDNRVDLQALCRASGAVHHRGRAVAADLGRRTLRLADGAELGFDRLSLDIGSRCRRPDFVPPGTAEAKPIAGLVAFADRLAAASATRPQRVLVVGGGPSGVELSGNLLRLSRRLPHALAVTLVASSPTLLPHAPERAGRIAAASLVRRGASLELGSALAAIGPDGEGGHVARLASVATLPFDHLLLATGLVAEAGIEGLPAPGEAGWRVAATLEMAEAPGIVAVGDCASIEGHALAELGVYGVRAAPVLADNLVASLEGRPLRYRPQRLALSILELGDGTGLAMRGGLVLRARAMLWWKRRIDRRFLGRYRPF